jgi:arginine decarboxylase
MNFFKSPLLKQSKLLTFAVNSRSNSLAFMKNRYIDLISQTFEFPQDGFEVKDNLLYFNDIPLMDIIEQYGTPLKISYLPKISSQIQKAKRLFNVAMAKEDYKGNYLYCYCTKSSHFEFVLAEALNNDIHLETSSAFDIPIIKQLTAEGKYDRDRMILCNGFKRPNYIQGIADLLEDGHTNVIPILDNKQELQDLKDAWANKLQIGIRIASEEEPNAEFYTSRLGIRHAEILDFYRNEIKNNKNLELKMLHFFINTGIKDTAYYWAELQRNINIYCELKKICPELEYLDIGGGFPIRTKLDFNYDYQYMADEIIRQIKLACANNDVEEPHIITEFGSFTVGESGAILYSIVGQKQQNDNEAWSMIDSSFITTLPDTWGIKQRFILLAINNWDKEYQRVNLGGITCDSDDYYIMESVRSRVFMPKPSPGETQYLGFFHTGAYQDSLGGYGGIQHCLIPAPKHVLIERDEDGGYSTRLFAKEQSSKSMMKILGY